MTVRVNSRAEFGVAISIHGLERGKNRKYFGLKGKPTNLLSFYVMGINLFFSILIWQSIETIVEKPSCNLYSV